MKVDDKFFFPIFAFFIIFPFLVCCCLNTFVRNRIYVDFFIDETDIEQMQIFLTNSNLGFYFIWVIFFCEDLRQWFTIVLCMGLFVLFCLCWNLMSYGEISFLWKTLWYWSFFIEFKFWWGKIFCIPRKLYRFEEIWWILLRHNFNVGKKNNESRNPS